MENLFSNVSEAQQKMIDGIFSGTYTLADAANLSKEDLEGFYTVAYNQYAVGNFKDAEAVFKFLALFEIWDPRFSLGYAGCLQAKGDYEKAIEVYTNSMMAGGLNDPTPLYQSAICFLRLSKVDEAIVSLQMALTTGDTTTYIDVREQAQNLLSVIEETSKENN